MTKKSEKSKQKNEKMSPAERENLLLGVMLGRGVRDTAKDWPDLGVLSIVRSEDQSGFLVKIKDNLVERVDHLTLRASISRWTEKLDTPFLLELRHVESLARRWAMCVPGIKIEDVKTVSWLDEDVLSWSKIPLKRGDVRPGNCPTWNSITKRMTNAAQFRAWVWSLFEPQSYQQQYCWLKGIGSDGKGSMVNALAKVLGPGFASLVVPGYNDTHWSMGLLGKRLCVFTEMEQPRFVTSARFKAMTGGDPLSANPKYGAIITFKPQAKYLILSQNSPEISSDRADTRRVVFCEFTETGPSEIDPHFAQKMDAEVGNFLGQCLEDYKSLCPNHEAIYPDQQTLNLLIHGEDFLESIFNSEFKYAPGEYLKASTFASKLNTLFPHKRSDRTEFREYLLRSKGINYTVLHPIGRVYKNLALKSVMDPSG